MFGKKKEKKARKSLTVGALKEVIKDLPDDAKVYVTSIACGSTYHKASGEQVFVGKGTGNLYLADLFINPEFDLGDEILDIMQEEAKKVTL